MKAVVIEAHGGLDVLQFRADFPDPNPMPDQVVVRVKATSLNYHDVFTRRGMPGIRLNFPVIMGLDVAGEIVDIGSEVTGWKIGDAVLIDPMNRVQGGLLGETVHGGLAELCAVYAHQLVRIPSGVSYASAAALPVAFGTARRMMLTRGRIQAGEKVLVLGASGGVGVCCVMLAKIAGAEVIACASTEAKLRRLGALGADHLLNYQEEDFVSWVHGRFGKPNRRKKGGGVDVVVNFTGGETWVKSLRVAARGGRILTCGATAGFDPKEDLRYIWSFELSILGSNGWERTDLEALLELVRSGKMSVRIDREFPLEETAEAMRLLEERQVVGKVLVTP